MSLLSWGSCFLDEMSECMQGWINRAAAISIPLRLDSHTRVCSIQYIEHFFAAAFVFAGVRTRGIRPLLSVVTPIKGVIKVSTGSRDEQLCHDVSPSIKGKSQQCVYYVCMETFRSKRECLMSVCMLFVCQFRARE